MTVNGQEGADLYILGLSLADSGRPLTPMETVMKIYSYKKCSTCVKALKFLDKKGVDYQEVDIYTKSPTKTELKKMLSIYDGNIKKIFNTSGLVYRSMKLSDKLKDMSDKEAIDLLASEGRLVKRPFVIVGDHGAVGFKEDEWKAFL